MYRFNLASINNLKRGFDLRAFNETAKSDEAKVLPQIVSDQMKEDQKILFELSYHWSYESGKDEIEFLDGEKMRPRIVHDSLSKAWAKTHSLNWSVQNEEKEIDDGLRLLRSLILNEILFLINPMGVNEEVIAELMLYSDALKGDVSNSYWYFLCEIFAKQNSDLYFTKNTREGVSL
tara:strand:- start:608 stop:1138 length:531 start_codon:yes stop_codon:yes gene_type:complete